MQDQTQMNQRERPGHDFDQVHCQHQKHRPGEQHLGRPHVRTPGSQKCFPAPVHQQNAVQTHPMKQHQENQNKRANTQRRKRLELIGNPQ